MKESLHREEINRRQVEADTMLREKDLRFEEEKKTWEEQMAALRSEIGMLNEEVERRREELSKINTRNEEKSQLQKELREQEERLTALKNEIAHLCEGAEPRRKAFLEEPVCQKITGSLLGVHVTARNSEAVRVPFSKQDATALRDAVCRHYRSFDTLLSSKNPLMSEDDLLLCHLFLLGLNDRQVSVLMFKSYSAVKKHVNRLEKALKLQGKLAEFLLQITGF